MKTLKMNLIIPLSIILMSSCKKDKLELPGVTETGAHTFGCMVNGQVMVADYSNIYAPKTGPTVTFTGPDENNNASFIISGEHRMSDGSSIIAVAFDIDSINYVVGKTYTFILNDNKKSGSGLGRFVKIVSSGSDIFYNTNAVVTGSVTLKIVSNTIIAGTFYFNAVSSTGDTVKITNGRFDW